VQGGCSSCLAPYRLKLLSGKIQWLVNNPSNPCIKGKIMSDLITPEIFNHLVELAALELNPEEAEYIRRQLNNQLKAINELAAIPLDESILPAAHGVPYTPLTSPTPRPDVWLPFDDPAGLLAQAPETEDGYISVADIPHTTLG
jgi:aspartyl/glutamyl-tRNA(Asn/Gln) amidotransferase C subunit